MNKSLIDGLLRGSEQFSTGAMVAVVAVITVFVVLLAIIVLSELVGKLIETSASKVPAVETAAPVAAKVATGSPLNLDDEDATVAALIASVDYRIETNMNIKVVSVKEVK